MISQLHPRPEGTGTSLASLATGAASTRSGETQLQASSPSNWNFPAPKLLTLNRGTPRRILKYTQSTPNRLCKRARDRPSALGRPAGYLHAPTLNKAGLVRQRRCSRFALSWRPRHPSLPHDNAIVHLGARRRYAAALAEVVQVGPDTMDLTRRAPDLPRRGRGALGSDAFFFPFSNGDGRAPVGVTSIAEPDISSATTFQHD